MEIHKPHAAKTWKEFFVELGTIVAGILIALSLEQAVEHWREHRQYVEARDAMRGELTSSFAFKERRNMISACAARRIAEIEILLDKAEQHQAFSPPRWIGGASSGRLNFAAESNAGRSGLFTVVELRQFGSVYSFLHSIDVEQDRERQAWGRLRWLEGRSSLSPETIANLRDALSQARFENERIPFLWSMAESYARPLTLTITTIPDQFMPEVFPHCLPMDTPPAEARRRTAYRNLDRLGASITEDGTH